MNVLLIGGGGREHALAWKLKQSPLLDRLDFARRAMPGSKLWQRASPSMWPTMRR